MPVTEVDRNPVVPAAQEARAIQEIDRALSSAPDDTHYYLADSTGHQTEISPSIFRVLAKAAREMAQGHSITILHYDHELTTQQAAELLGVSRPYFVSVLEAGKVAYHMAGTHRRVYMRDLLAYKQRRDTLRHEHLRELRRVSESLGLYDDGSSS